MGIGALMPVDLLEASESAVSMAPVRCGSERRGKAVRLGGEVLAPGSICSQFLNCI